MTAADRFVAAARDAGLEVAVHHWPEGTRTAEDAARAVGCDVAQIVKTLVFVADGQAVVALTSGSNRVDTDRLRDVIGATEGRMADADEVREATGFAIGGTPPLGHPQRLRVLIDPDLLSYDEVWAGAGTPDTTFPADPAELQRAASAQAAAFTEQG